VRVRVSGSSTVQVRLPCHPGIRCMVLPAVAGKNVVCSFITV